jgi:AraC-like DNA-binding protein
MRSLYIETNECPIDWVAPTAVAMTELFRELVDHLGLESLGASERSHAEALLVDLLQPVSVMTIDVEMPTEARAREVAQRVAHSPEDRRTLGEWGHEVGASDRTLARVFVKETGLGFGRWRTLVRIQAALGMLAAGESVTNVAYRVGYDTTSAFVAAFRRETGTTPAAYFRTSGTR